MPEKNNNVSEKKNNLPEKKNNKAPQKKHKLTIGQRMADNLALVAGSWSFIIGFVVFLVVWIILNSIFLIFGIWDQYPFILLNLFLSCLAAIQAPVILMSQNRAAQRDRQQAAKDYYINRKAEKEIKLLQIQMLELKELISKQSIEKETKKIEDEIKLIQLELENMGKTLQIE